MLLHSGLLHVERALLQSCPDFVEDGSRFYFVVSFQCVWGSRGSAACQCGFLLEEHAAGFVHCWLAGRGRRVSSWARSSSGQPAGSFSPPNALETALASSCLED